MGLVSFGDLPETPDPQAVLSAGTAVASAARGVHRAAADAATSWQALPGLVSAPGYIDALYSSLQPATADAEDLLRAATRLQRVVEDFAAEIESIRRRADSLRQEILSLYARAGLDVLRPGAVVLLDTIRGVLGNETELQTFLGRSDQLQEEVQALQRYWSAVQHEAAATILAIQAGEGADLPRVAAAGRMGSSGGPAPVLALESLGSAARRGPKAVHAWLVAHPDLGALLERSQPDATLVHTWWTALPPAAQAALIAGSPTVLGNLNGVAYGARAKANASVLDSQITDLTARIAAEKALLRAHPESGTSLRAEMAAAEAQLGDYRSIRAALQAVPGTHRALVELETGSQPPLAAVAIGDLDHAGTVTYTVPGMTATTADMAGWAGASQRIYDGQAAAASGTFAVVAWMGYRTPGAPPGDFGVLGSADARIGAGRLNAAIAGVGAVREDRVTLNVVAHSYGTTTASLALAAHDERVHSFVMIGSAGIDPSVPDAAAMHADAVYAGQASDALPAVGNGQGDQWAWIGRDFSGRANPMDPSFGATTFGTSGRDGAGAATTAHDTNVPDPGPSNGYGYLDANSESLYNVVHATTTGRDLTPYAPSDYVHLTPGSIAAGGISQELLRESVEADRRRLEALGVPEPMIDVILMRTYL